LILTAAYTGMRAGELHGLRRDRLDLLRGRIDVVESLSEVPKSASPTGLLLGPTKTGRPRSIRLPTPLLRTLQEHIANFPSPDGFVFPAANGGPQRHGNFYLRRYKPAVQRAGLPDGVRFHDLRHTAAAFFIADGCNAKQVMDRLGHSTIRVTYDRYGHLLDGHDDELVAKLEERWNTATGTEA
jgi:integrase